MKKSRWLLFFLSLFLLSCSGLRVESDLAPAEKEFLSTVRYIITRQEKKEFKNLPPSDRQDFIERFWKKRDPDPETEANEYKDEYYSRLDAARHLFTEGGASGWLTDRGRIYILLGPPEQRETYPRGYGFYDPPMEIWYYGFHQLFFVDSRWNGNFELQPQSARMLSLINAAQVELRPQVEKDKVFFDFNLETVKQPEGGLLVRLSIPYKNIWFSSEGQELKTTLELSLKVFDASGKQLLKEETKSNPISLSQETLKEAMGKDYVIEVPLDLEPGEYRLTLNLKNLTDQTEVRKNIKLTI